MPNRTSIASILLSLVGSIVLFSAEVDAQEALIIDKPREIEKAQEIGRTRKLLQQQPDGLYIAEAEEFQLLEPKGESVGWVPQQLGKNYYAATFANAFLSRKAFLGAPAQCNETIASLDVEIAESGRYLVLARYEAAFRFETQFGIEILQQGRSVFHRKYGGRDQLKIWAFSQKLQTEVGWSWGAGENMVWEGHDAWADLEAGPASIRLIAREQPEPAAKRHIDLVMLTSDQQQVEQRIEKESYLPLDGMLTQSGDVYLRVTNLSSEPLVFQGKAAPGGGNWQQHSPYWVHQRDWKLPSISIESNQTSEWVEVGSNMDTLADGQWFWTGDQTYKAEFGIRELDGSIQTLAVFEGEGDLPLAADADTRYRRRLRRQEQVLYDLLAELKRDPPTANTLAPTSTPIYAVTFDALDQGEHSAAVEEFKSLFSLTDTEPDASPNRGYIDVRGVPTSQLAEHCKKLGDQAQNVRVVSLGDEISLPSPSGANVDADFQQWLKSQGLTTNAILKGQPLPKEGPLYRIDETSKSQWPGIYYWSRRYQYHYGIQEIKKRTDILRQWLPNASIGANFSPHYPQEHMFLGEVFKWVTVFRDEGMTLPWSEDYIWQLPVGTPQMNNINLDLFRAANRHAADRDVMYYVMPHMPNNTPRQWRRLFFSALGHGMTMVNLFEFRPVHVAYTENHVDDPEMYRMILKSFRELAKFEDVIQNGNPVQGKAALWFSETADIWDDNHGSFAAAKRSLYTLLRHQQIPLDFVVEADAIDGTLDQYRVLYLTDAHVSQRASHALWKWVQQGGTLFATAGAGQFDEYNEPNVTLQNLLGLRHRKMETPENSQITWIKQDLPFAQPIDTLKPTSELLKRDSSSSETGSATRIFGAKDTFAPTDDAQALLKFSADSPAAIRRKAGEGEVVYCGFLPGLSYFAPAIPRQPVDRGATDDALVHFLPTDFDRMMMELVRETTLTKVRPEILSNDGLVESLWVQSPEGSAVILVNWSSTPKSQLTVQLPKAWEGKTITRASGLPIQIQVNQGIPEVTLELDVADALMIQ
jgi:hypothetical protein